MNKRDLVELIMHQKDSPFPTKAAAKRGVDAILYGIKKGLSKDQVVQLIGFGTFKLKRSRAHYGRSPRTGSPIIIPTKIRTAFKPGKAMDDRFNPERKSSYKLKPSEMKAWRKEKGYDN